MKTPNISHSLLITLNVTALKSNSKAILALLSLTLSSALTLTASAKAQKTTSTGNSTLSAEEEALAQELLPGAEAKFLEELF